jgi:hypothetical protein
MTDFAYLLPCAPLKQAKQCMAGEGLHECGFCSPREAIFATSDHRFHFSEGIVLYLAFLRVAVVQGEKPNRIARLLS